MLFSNLFSKEEVNTGRQPSLDYAKGLAIVCMVICHTVMMFSMGHTDMAYIVSDKVLGGPIAAPLFMICLGIGTCYSRHSAPLLMVKRGAGLFLCAYLLNFMRGVLPLALGSLFVGWQAVAQYMTWAMLVGDILQFAGLAFIFLGVVKKIGLTDWQLVCTAFICALVGSMCAGYDTGDNNINALLGLFIPAGAPDGQDCVSAFPFLNWIIFPVVGILFGKLLRHSTDSDKFYGLVLAVTLPLTIFYGWYSLAKGFMPFSGGHYFWPTIADSVFFIAYDLCIISLLHFLSRVIPVAVFSPLAALSRQINTVYCISWVVIVWTAIPVLLATDMNGIDSLAAYPIGIVITAVSYGLALLWSRYKNRRKEKSSTVN